MGARAIRDRASGRFGVATAALVTLIAVGASTPVHGQTTDADGKPIRSTLSPTVRMTVGSDDNIFRVNTADNPIADFTTTISPAVQGALVVQRLRITGRGELDFINFRKVT